jgi:hypothetical protein
MLSDEFACRPLSVSESDVPGPDIALDFLKRPRRACQHPSHGSVPDRPLQPQNETGVDRPDRDRLGRGAFRAGGGDPCATICPDSASHDALILIGVVLRSNPSNY